MQIGETKYGKPILDRVVEYDMPLDRGAKAALISFDSTMRSNLSVGLPLDLVVYREGALGVSHHQDIGHDNEYFHNLREDYGARLLDVFNGLPNPDID